MSVSSAGGWRQGCACTSSPREAAAPVPRLLADTAFGTSAFALCLHERFACCRPLRQVAEWMTGQGLAISAGTLADATPGPAPLFEPLSQAIHGHLPAREMLQTGETGWRSRKRVPSAALTGPGSGAPPAGMRSGCASMPAGIPGASAPKVHQGRTRQCKAGQMAGPVAGADRADLPPERAPAQAPGQGGGNGCAATQLRHCPAPAGKSGGAALCHGRAGTGRQGPTRQGTGLAGPAPAGALRVRLQAGCAHG